MRLVYFTHALASCWNNGNAHFLRGVLRELRALGHEAIAYQPRAGWSITNLLADHGSGALDSFRSAYPELEPIDYDPDVDLEACANGADVVIVHEWNEPWLVSGLGRLRKIGGKFTLLFHDTHHRAVSDPRAMGEFDLSGYDAVLAFGEALAEVYRRRGWGRNVYVWHEAADTRLFRPHDTQIDRRGLVWIGNWGDEERSQEIADFLLWPAKNAALELDVYGVRYPVAALDALKSCGAQYRGWLPNTRVPPIFAEHMATVHVPRRLYAKQLPGIPTIRVFEALACGIPLVSAPWEDIEGLFRCGEDFLMANSPAEMERCLIALKHDADLRRSLMEKGRETIEARHTCRHRALELLNIIAKLRTGLEEVAA